jgi:hypothetical protein
MLEQTQERGADSTYGWLDPFLRVGPNNSDRRSVRHHDQAPLRGQHVRRRWLNQSAVWQVVDHVVFGRQLESSETPALSLSSAVREIQESNQSRAAFRAGRLTSAFSTSCQVPRISRRRSVSDFT